MNYSLARFSVRPASARAARQALQKLLAAVQKHDPGLVYLVFQDSNQSSFVTLVSFENEGAYRRHAESRHAAAFARKMAALCEERPSFVGLDLVTATRRWSGPSVTPTASPSTSARRARRTSVRVGPSRRRRPVA